MAETSPQPKPAATTETPAKSTAPTEAPAKPAAPAPPTDRLPGDFRPRTTLQPKRSFDNPFSRHPYRTIFGGLFAIGLAGATLGYCTSGGGEESKGDTGVVTSEQGPGGNASAGSTTFANTNPKGRLACAMVVEQAGTGDNDPYRLHTYVTQGTPAANSHVTYSATYQKSGAEAHHVGPFTATVNSEPAIQAANHGAPLAAVEGQIAGSQAATCTVTIIRN